LGRTLVIPGGVSGGHVKLKDLVDPRKATTYGLIYAAGYFAQRLGILPLEDVEASIRIVCERAERHARPAAILTPADQINAYIRENRERIFDLDCGAPPDLDNAALDQHAGFLKVINKQRHLLVRSERLGQVVPQIDGAAAVLANGGLLHATDGLQHQCRVRHSKKKDRVYAIVIPTRAGEN